MFNFDNIAVSIIENNIEVIFNTDATKGIFDIDMRFPQCRRCTGTP